MYNIILHLYVFISKLYIYLYKSIISKDIM